MKTYFTDIEVECWVHDGRIGVWEPSVCLFHRKPEDGRALLKALEELRSDETPSKRKLTFKPASRERAVSVLRLRLVAERPELRVMNISAADGAVAIEITDTGWQITRDALASWFAGGEDFGISPMHARMKKRDLGKDDLASGELWFWGPGYAGP